MPDQRSLLRGRLAVALGDVVDVAARLAPEPIEATPAQPPSPPSLESAGRPWTLAAAMEPVSAAIAEGVAAPYSSSRPSMPPPPPEHHRSRLPIGVVGSSVLVVLAVILVHLFNSGATVPAPTHSIGQISLTGVRPVASAPAAGAVPVTQVSFPARTSVVDIEVNSGGAAGQAPVQVLVTVGEPAQTIIDNAYVLNQSGNTVIPLTAPGGVFAPGNYSVTITYKGVMVGSTEFAIQ